MRDKRLGTGIVICLGLLAGCTSGGTPTAYQAAEASKVASPVAISMAEAPEADDSETYTVSMDNHRFMPETITIPAGSTVTWVNNEEGVPHTTTSDTGLWDSGNMSTGQSYSYRFDQPGTYPYNCTLHRDQGMVGTIIVE
jgi:plastocyanin